MNEDTPEEIAQHEATARLYEWVRDHRAVIDSLISGTHVVVPKEATEAMREAGGEVNGGEYAIGGIVAEEVYRAMLSAASEG